MSSSRRVNINKPRATDDDKKPSIFERSKHLVRLLLRKCYASCVKSSPPKLAEEVLELLEQLGVSEAEKLEMYHRFHRIRQAESEDVVRVATEIATDSMIGLVTTRQRSVKRLLFHIMDLGGCDNGMVTWDNFLYIFLQFNSLSRVELCQALFMIIIREVQSKVLHYLTTEQLQKYYAFYSKSPVRAFNTRAIDFTKLPLRRYYVTDFTELAQRFTELLNPIIHLQRCLQETLPSAEFWEEFDRNENFCRKISLEFFSIHKTRTHLRGEPPFLETCDMLAPDALGCQAVNHEQWNIRTYALHERIGAVTDDGGIGPGGRLPPAGYQYRSLVQTSVWGEQPPPEDLAHLRKCHAQLETKKAAIAHMRDKMSSTLWVDGDSGARDQKKKNLKGRKHRLAAAKRAAAAKAKAAAASLAVEEPEVDSPEAPLRELGATTEAPPQAQAANSRRPTVIGRSLLDNPAELALQAAYVDEDKLPPVDVLPPLWMRGCTIAPAPRHVADGSPSAALRSTGMNGEARTTGVTAATQNSGMRVSFVESRV